MLDRFDFDWGSPNCIGCPELAHRQHHLSVHPLLHRRNPPPVSPNWFRPWRQLDPSSKISCSFGPLPKQGLSVGKGLRWSCEHEMLYILKRCVWPRDTYELKEMVPVLPPSWCPARLGCTIKAKPLVGKSANTLVMYVIIKLLKVAEMMPTVGKFMIKITQWSSLAPFETC